MSLFPSPADGFELLGFFPPDPPCLLRSSFSHFVSSLFTFCCLNAFSRSHFVILSGTSSIVFFLSVFLRVAAAGFLGFLQKAEILDCITLLTSGCTGSGGGFETWLLA